jgi:hypothetical protein
VFRWNTENARGPEKVKQGVSWCMHHACVTVSACKRICVLQGRESRKAVSRERPSACLREEEQRGQTEKDAIYTH